MRLERGDSKEFLTASEHQGVELVRGVRLSQHAEPVQEGEFQLLGLLVAVQLLEQEDSGVHTDFSATVLQNQRNLDIEADSEGHFGPSFSSQTPFRGIVF